MSIPISGLAPLLSVFDMPAAIHFYRDIVGFEVAATSKPAENYYWALLRLSGVELMLNTAYDDGERPDAPDAARAAAHGDTVLYFGCADLDDAYQYLRSQGLPVEAPVTRFYGMRQLTVQDPDGYQICFQWPAARD